MTTHRGFSVLMRVPGLCFGMAIVAFAAYVAHIVFGVGGADTDSFFDEYGYNAAMLGFALALIMRAASRKADRAALLVIGLGLLTWAFGDLYYTVFYASLKNPPFPSVDDALYLGYYLFLFVGLGLLIRSRFRGINATHWLDGLIAGLGLSAVAAGVVLDPILAATGGTTAAVATNLAYPVGDLLLFLVVVAAIGLTGWRPGRVWALMAFALLVNVTADTTYLFQVANSTYQEGTWLETLWPLSSFLLVLALWMPAPATRRTLAEGWRNIAVPGVGALAAVGVLFVDHGHIRVNDPARYLAVATLLVAVFRVLTSFRRALRSQQESRLHAMTDELTGLGNRRMLVGDLDEAIEIASAADPRLLVMYDLNGFKAYNDTFGHPAGDSLLARLAQNLAATVAPYGRAYRMGGDEFCALLAPGDAPIGKLAAATAAALREVGPGFEIDAAHGAVLMPSDASSPSRVLHLVDHRLYANKETRPVGVKRQLRGLMLQVLGEREPALLHHLDAVAVLALAVGRRMKLNTEDLDVLARAAEMHDVGKMAVPETIINKPGPLDADEWAFMRSHTILGERMLSAAPALIPVAKLVRSSHERWDGAGYPDGLAGDEIPLGSRIVCVCDAYDAIVSARPYAVARSSDEALAELARCAGSQFDAKVVEALTAVITTEDTGVQASEAPASGAWSGLLSSAVHA